MAGTAQHNQVVEAVVAGFAGSDEGVMRFEVVSFAAPGAPVAGCL
jgi:hypothetical protein